MSNYLNDKSNNDYQLIRDISQLLRNYKNKNKRVDRKFVDKVLDVLLMNDSLTVNRTKFVSDCDGGYYDYTDKTIGINFQSLQENRKNYKYIKSKDGNLYEYYVFLIVILHEFTHAKQYKIIEQGTKYAVSAIYRYSDNFLRNNTDLYNLNHDTVPYERFANIRSFYLTIEILKRVYSIKELWHFQYAFLYDLLYNYDDEGLFPLKKFNELVESNSLPKFSHLIPNINVCEDNLYEKLNIGLPITEEDFNYLKGIRTNYFAHKENCIDVNFDLSAALVKRKSKVN